MKPLKILSHNVFWFQGASFATDSPPGPAPDILGRLCDLYKKANPDVICLQEIQSRDAFAAICRHLEMEGCYCEGNELTQYGGAVLWRPGSARRPCDSRQAQGETQRMWQIVEVNRGDHSLRICNIHLPSGRQLGPDEAAAKRVAEIQGAIGSCSDKPDIIAGDFNERPGGPMSLCMESHDYADAAILSDRGDVATNISQFRGDYIWLRSSMSTRLLEYGAAAKECLSHGAAGKGYLSDHLPLWIVL